MSNEFALTSFQVICGHLFPILVIEFDIQIIYPCLCIYLVTASQIQSINNLSTNQSSGAHLFNYSSIHHHITENVEIYIRR